MTDSRIHNEDVLVATKGDSDSRLSNLDVLVAVNADPRIDFYNLDVLLATYYDETVAFGPTDFTGANGDQWPVEEWYTTTGPGGGGASQENGKGRLNGSTGNGNSGGKGRAIEGKIPNQTATGTFQLTAIDEPCTTSFWLQASDDWLGADPDSPTSGYGVRLPSDSADAELVVVLDGVETQLATAAWPKTTGEFEWLFSRQGQNIGFKLWPVADPEPEDWLLVAQDSTLPVNSAGSFQLAYYCDAAPATDAGNDFDDVVVDDSDTPFPGGGGNRMGGTGAVRRSPNTGGVNR